jgi:CheY-like chemotaxis protein
MKTSRMPTILLVSRDQQLVYLIERYVSNCGCQLVRPGYGVNITSVIMRSRPDAILLDVSQASPGGQAVLQELKSKPETRLIPVILCATSETDWLDCEAEGRLLQPILFSEFVIAVEEAGIKTPKSAKEA